MLGKFLEGKTQKMPLSMSIPKALVVELRISKPNEWPSNRYIISFINQGLPIFHIHKK